VKEKIAKRRQKSIAAASQTEMTKIFRKSLERLELLLIEGD